MGRAGALAFAREGAQVIATDRDPALLASLQGIDGVRTLTLDVLSSRGGMLSCTTNL
jgi:2-keto-3-deoxy-L-fuconate dehydrogenase